MEWSDRGIVLSSRPHGETGLVTTLLTRLHGRHAGFVAGGISRKSRPTWQSGNVVEVEWRAKQLEQLGHYTGELREAHAARAMDDAVELAGLSAACALIGRPLSPSTCPALTGAIVTGPTSASAMRPKPSAPTPPCWSMSSCARGRIPSRVSGLCQLSRRLIDDVSAILPRAQAVSRMPSAIAALRMCCQRRVAAGTRWRMRDLQRRKFRSSSWPRQYRLADPVLFNPSIGRHRPLMPR